MLPVISLGAESPGGLALPAAASAPDQFYGPRGLVLIGSTLIVCDTGNHRVLIFRDLCDGIVNPKATTVLGQPDFYSESHSNGGGSRGLFLPTGVTTRDNRLIVADAWHHRVLIWDDIPTENWTGADHVIGQVAMDDVEPNRGGECSSASLYWPFGVGFVEDRFFIADTGNRRILGWDHLPLDGELPDVIVGQSDFSSRQENRGEVGPSSFRWPHSIAGDGDGMYVADAGNHRVLMFDPKIDKDCDALCVIGQADPYSNSEWPYGPQSPNVYRFPYAIAKDGDRFVVADTANNRVLLYDKPPKSYGDLPYGVIGQNDFSSNGENRWTGVAPDTLCWPYGISLDGDRLAIADTGNNRVMIWDIARN